MSSQDGLGQRVEQLGAGVIDMAPAFCDPAYANLFDIDPKFGDVEAL